MSPKYPHINVNLIGKDGNAFFILAEVIRAMKLAHISINEINDFRKEATSGDYNHLLYTVMQWVNVGDENESDDDWDDDDDDDCDFDEE